MRSSPAFRRFASINIGPFVTIWSRGVVLKCAQLALSAHCITSICGFVGEATGGAAVVGAGLGAPGEVPGGGAGVPGVLAGGVAGGGGLDDPEALPEMLN